MYRTPRSHLSELPIGLFGYINILKCIGGQGEYKKGSFISAAIDMLFFVLLSVNLGTNLGF